MKSNNLFLRTNLNHMSGFVCAVLLLLATASVSTARTLTWTGSGASLSTHWSDPGNWNPSGPPATGDTLVFPAGFTPYNDMVNLQVHSIQFTGNGSTYLSGNPITVESDITAANNNGEARVSFDITFSSGGGTFYCLGSSFLNIEDNVILGNNLALNLYAQGANILVQGSIQGAADLVKLGPGDAYLQGTLANTYTGGTYVRGGKLHLAKSANVVAISPKLSVGENTTVPGSVADENPGQYPPLMDVTVGPYGLWVLNGQTAVTNLSLINATGIGGGNISGSGILTLDCDVNLSGPIDSDISCTLYLGNQTRAFNVQGALAVSSIVGIGTAGITKNGSGQLVLTSPNDYAGPTLVHDGILAVDNAFALGASLGANAGTTVDPNAVIQFDSVTTAEPFAFNYSYVYFSGSNTLNGTITLNGGCGMNAEFPNSSKQVLQINSVISGTGGLAIDGGIVRLAGPNPNTFTDGVQVGIGAYFEQDYPATLDLAKPNNVLAVPGLLDVESSPLNGVAPAIVRNFEDNGVADVRLGHGAQWLLNGHVAAPASLTFDGDGLINTQGGQLQMTSPPGTSQIHVATRPALGNYTAQILGTLAMLAPTDEFYVESGPTLQVSALITGPGNLSKTGPGVLTIAGTDFNNYAGETFVNQGTLQLNKPLAATAIPGAVEVGAVDGSSAGTLRNLNSYQIVGGIYIHSQGLYDVNGQVENTDYLSLDGNAVVQTGTGYLSMKTGAGITVNPGVNTTATINGNMFLDSGGHVITVGSGSSLLGVQDLVINAAIGENSPPASIQKEGPGQMRLSGNSSYSGPTFINHGKVFPTGPGALGATNSLGYTYVSNDATLVLDGGVTIPGETLFLNSIAPAALESRSGSNTWAGLMYLTGDSRIAVTNAMNAYCVINGNGNLIKVGPGTLILDGHGANGYSGDTFVNEGTLAMKKDQLDTISIPHNVTVGTGPGGPPATLLNLNEGTIAGRVTVNDGGIWNLNNWFGDFQSDAILGGPALTLNGSAAVQTGGFSLLNGGGIVVNAGNNTTATVSSQIGFFYADTLHITVSTGGNQAGKPECIISGAISQFVPPSNLLKDGAGTLRLTGTNTYTGTNFVTAGALWIDGVQPQSSVLLTGGTLGGYGTAGNILMNGGSAIVSPGESPGILTCSNFNASSGTFRAELNGSTPGSGYDQLNARGTVSLNGISLNASLNYASAAADQFTIINNDGSDAVVGTFTGLPQGKKLYVGKELFQISYTGGSGNDVVLSRLVTPPPPTLTIQSVPPASVRLLWLTNEPPFSLQTGTNLSGTNWAAALPLPTVIGSTNVVINPATNTQRFYRLAVP
jgi:fibronectin-binding autotransporter adhesin